jgi:nucleoside 2-deoxyribosyltransferase
MKKIYLAGPDVFYPNAIGIGKARVEYLKERGLKGLYPLDNELENQGPLQTGAAIAKINRERIEESDGVLANLIAFRGPSADTGTVWECAYAKGLGKIVVGYGYDPRPYKDKVIGTVPHDGMIVENFRVWDNIMLVYGLDGSFVSWDDAVAYIAKRLGHTWVDGQGRKCSDV